MMKYLLANSLDLFGLAFWIELQTKSPRCTYYFGPFSTSQDAELALPGFIEDLETEGAEGLTATISRCKPRTLTIEEGIDVPFASGSVPAIG